MNAFKIIVGIESMIVMVPNCKSKKLFWNDTPSGANRQLNVELEELLFVSLLFIFMLNFHEECLWPAQMHTAP